MRKGRASVQDVILFAKLARPREVHLLGLGLRSRSARLFLPLLARQFSGINVSMDANLITAAVGRRIDGSAARRLTAAQDAIRRRGFPDPFGETSEPEWQIHADYTDSASFPSSWLGPAGLRNVAAAAGLSPEQTAQWRKDPDAFLQRRIAPHGDAPRWWQNPVLDLAIESEWMRHLHRIHAAPRKARAICSVFHDHPAAGQFTRITLQHHA
jgi:hypothetical protein